MSICKNEPSNMLVESWSAGKMAMVQIYPNESADKLQVTRNLSIKSSINVNVLFGRAVLK